MPTKEELLRAPLLKLERAGHHINDLATQIDTFLAEHPFKLLVRHNRKAGKQTFRTKAEKPVPDEFSLIIGDAVHNLRSALDLCLYQLAHSRADKPDRIQFPFAKDDIPKTLAGAIKDGRVKFAGTKVVEAVQCLKPHPTGNPELCAIHTLDVRDKHRLLILSAGKAVFTTGTGNEEAIKGALGKSPKPGVHIVLAGPHDEDILTINRPYVLRDLPTSEQEAKVQPAFQITFAEIDRGFGFVLDTLVKGAKEARRAVDALIDAYLDPNNTFPP